MLFGEAALGVYSLQGFRSPGADKTVVTLGVRMHPIIRRTVRFVGELLCVCVCQGDTFFRKCQFLPYPFLPQR